MQLTKKQMIISAAVYTVVIFAAGRYTSSYTSTDTKKEVKTDVQTKTEDQKIKTDTDRDQHINTVTVEKVLPDGTKETTTTKTEDTSTQRKTDTVKNETDKDTSTDTTTETKKIESGRSKLTLSVLAGANVTNLSGGFVYGVHVTKDILGPINLGLFGLSNGTAGASLGISF